MNEIISMVYKTNAVIIENKTHAPSSYTQHVHATTLQTLQKSQTIAQKPT
jgi:hypothetical protein